MAGGIQAGAAAGSAFGPWGTAIGAGVGALTDMMGASKGGAPAGPSRADAANWAGFDSSNWTVATGNGKASAQDIPWNWVMVGAVVLLLIYTRRHK